MDRGGVKSCDWSSLYQVSSPQSITMAREVRSYRKVGAPLLTLRIKEHHKNTMGGPCG